MSGTYEFPTGADGELTPQLRAVYAAPRDEAYWGRLEARILARVGVEGPTWWQVLGGWTRPALLAAGLVALVAGLAALRSEQDDIRAAYDVVLEQSPALPAPMATAAALPAVRERVRDPLDY